MKISTVVAVSALLREIDPALLDSALKSMTGGASDYFDNEFTVIDLAGCDLTGHTVDWPALISLFKSYSLNPVAVRHAPAEMEADIVSHGLSIDIVARPRQQVEEEATPEPDPAPAPIPAPAPAIAESTSPPPMPQQSAAAMIIDTPVRAGQRIYARGADLIVTAVVNSGAELIADGSIHIYAPLRGRALAGASGNAEARIFALSMEAELISIAGTYRTFENGLPKEFAMKPAQVRLDGDRIDVLPIHTRA